MHNVFVKDVPHLQRAIRRWIRVTKNKNNRGHTTTGLGRQKPLNESERLLLETMIGKKKTLNNNLMVIFFIKYFLTVLSREIWNSSIPETVQSLRVFLKKEWNFRTYTHRDGLELIHHHEAEHVGAVVDADNIRNIAIHVPGAGEEWYPYEKKEGGFWKPPFFFYHYSRSSSARSEQCALCGLPYYDREQHERPDQRVQAHGGVSVQHRLCGYTCENFVLFLKMP